MWTKIMKHCFFLLDFPNFLSNQVLVKMGHLIPSCNETPKSLLALKKSALDARVGQSDLGAGVLVCSGRTAPG